MASADAPGATDSASSTARRRWLWLALGPALALGLQLFPPPDGLSREGWIVVSLAIVMAVWWVTEAIPIPVTALLPLVVLPLTGVLPLARASAPYMSPIVVLLMGGFIIATAIERWNLHARIALTIVARMSASPAGLIGGFMLGAGLLSMWISNTATTLMMTPIALSAAAALGGASSDKRGFAAALLLGVAYAASIGGLATPVGTPTNLIVMGWLKQNASIDISFGEWMAVGLPVVGLMLPLAWASLTWRLRGLAPAGGGATAARALMRRELEALGPITTPEWRVMMVFAVIAGAWVFGGLLQKLAPLRHLDDQIVAAAGAIAMFLVPSGAKGDQAGALLDWRTAERIPWGVVLLFGGGLSLAAAISQTGLAEWMGGQFASVTKLPLIMVMLLVTTFVIFFTELTSNVATASALMPVIGALAIAGGANPALLAAPLGMAASCAFMLPMATGPNAVVFGTGQVPIRAMAAAGLRLNLIGILVITGVVYLAAPLAFR